MSEANEDVAVGRVLLPQVKLSAASNTKQLEKRFNYLWQTAHTSIATCAPVAHQMIASMMQSARLNRVVLPAEVLDFVCERCAGLLVPTVSADVRVVPMAAKAAANRKLARQRRRAKRSTVAPVAPEVITNALRVTCRRCKHANLRAAATVVNKPKSKKVKDKKRTLVETNDGSNTLDQEQPAPKRAKTSNDSGKPSTINASEPPAASTTQQRQSEKQAQAPSVLESLLALPPSPPRKLLDGPKRKKKKKPVTVDPAAAAAKSSLTSFLQSLRPGTSK